MCNVYFIVLAYYHVVILFLS